MKVLCYVLSKYILTWLPTLTVSISYYLQTQKMKTEDLLFSCFSRLPSRAVQYYKISYFKLDNIGPLP